MKKGDRVRIIGDFPKEAFATVIRKGHKDKWVIKIDGTLKNVEFNEKGLEVVEQE